MINYFLGLATLPVLTVLLFGTVLFNDRGLGHTCKICGHVVSSSHRRVFSWYLWKWHSYVGCTVRGKANRRAWVLAKDSLDALQGQMLLDTLLEEFRTLGEKR